MPNEPIPPPDPTTALARGAAGEAPPDLLPPDLLPPDLLPPDLLAAESLMSKTARGAGWMIGWQATTRLLGLLTTLLLARLLLPADFGVVAIAMSFVQGIETLAFLGVEEALIRQPQPAREMYDTGFTLVVLRNLSIALLLCAVSVPAAGWFGEPRLTHVLLALAAGVAVSGFGNIGVVDYRRSFAFVMVFRQMVVPRLISVTLTLTLALWLHSYWALVAGAVSMRVTQVIAGYVLHPYRPRLTLRLWRSLLGYSMWALAQTAAVVARDRTHTLVISHMLGARAIGIYSVGEDIAMMPSNELLAPLARVAFSSFAATPDTPTKAPGGEAARAYLRLVSGTALLAMPMGFGLSLTAGAVVALAFGPGWGEAVPVMRVLGVIGALMVFAYMGSTLFFAHARMAASFRITCTAAATRLGLLLALLGPFGLVGAAWAMGVAELVETVLYIELIARRYGLRRLALLRDTWRCAVATACMAAVLYATGLGWAPSPPGSGPAALQLVQAIPLGIAVYAAVLLGAWLAMGRPPGPEADSLRLARRMLRR